jgi:hypothetical protein
VFVKCSLYSFSALARSHDKSIIARIIQNIGASDRTAKKNKQTCNEAYLTLAYKTKRKCENQAKKTELRLRGKARMRQDDNLSNHNEYHTQTAVIGSTVGVVTNVAMNCI